MLTQSVLFKRHSSGSRFCSLAFGFPATTRARPSISMSNMTCAWGTANSQSLDMSFLRALGSNERLTSAGLETILTCRLTSMREVALVLLLNVSRITAPYHKSPMSKPPTGPELRFNRSKRETLRHEPLLSFAALCHPLA